MKRVPIILALFIVAITFATFEHFFGEQKQPKKTTELAKASQLAFANLDRKLVRCTPAKFEYEVANPDRPVAPLFENLGNHHFKVTTNVEKAQTFFDQGIRLTYAFNHAEAHRSFMEAARLDPTCAMAFWGQAYALGPNINDPMPDNERRLKAYEASEKAKQLMMHATEKEMAMINALSKRYSKNVMSELGELNQTYVEAMKEVVERYREDADIQTLYGAAIMNTMPWNYWDNEGNPNPGTMDAKKALETAMKLNPEHPGAHHYYIHMVELPYPETGIVSAEKLGSLMPGAGHLVHMPAHIFIRIGRYEEAVKSNIGAIEADEDYISQCYAQGLYPLAYYPHNIHFLWSAASFLGDSRTALEASKKTAEKIPVSELNTFTFLQDYFSTPMLANLRFGKWNEVLTTPQPGKDYKHVMLIWHYTRGIAFLRKQNMKDAKEELMAIEKMLEDPDLETLIANYTNPTINVAKVAQRVLAGEIAAANGDYQMAIELLKEGVKFEDELVYSEPAAWHIPVRQTLGAVFLKANMPVEAEMVYREDLEINRNNGWSLIGLHNSLKAQGKNPEAKETKKQFDKSWELSDMMITSSIL
ncbi:tetratricopeptide repeat protein [Rapidithrix thailandica]